MRAVDDREQRMRALVADVGEPVRRYLHRRADAATADDVYGDVLLVCWRRLDDVPSGDDTLPWVFVVARQCLANAQRAERRRTRLVGRIIAIDPPTAAERADDAAVDSDDADLRTALARLRTADAELLRLWAWDDLSNRQLAVVLGISDNAVAIRLHRAKARLRDELLSLERLRDENDHGAQRPRLIALKASPPAGHVEAEEGSTDARR